MFGRQSDALQTNGQTNVASWYRWTSIESVTRYPHTRTPRSSQQSTLATLLAHSAHLRFVGVPLLARLEHGSRAKPSARRGKPADEERAEQNNEEGYARWQVHSYIEFLV